MKKEMQVSTFLRGQNRKSNDINTYYYVVADNAQRDYISERLALLWMKRENMTSSNVTDLNAIAGRWFLEGKGLTPDMFGILDKLCRSSRHRVRQILVISHDDGLVDKGNAYGSQPAISRRIHASKFLKSRYGDIDLKAMWADFSTGADRDCDTFTIDLPKPSRDAIKDTVASLIGDKIDALEGVSGRMKGIEEIVSNLNSRLAHEIYQLEQENESLRDGVEISKKGNKIAYEALDALENKCSKIEAENKSLKISVSEIYKVISREKENGKINKTIKNNDNVKVFPDTENEFFI